MKKNDDVIHAEIGVVSTSLRCHTINRLSIVDGCAGFNQYRNQSSGGHNAKDNT